MGRLAGVPAGPLALRLIMVNSIDCPQDSRNGQCQPGSVMPACLLPSYTLTWASLRRSLSVLLTDDGECDTAVSVRARLSAKSRQRWMNSASSSSVTYARPIFRMLAWISPHITMLLKLSATCARAASPHCALREVTIPLKPYQTGPKLTLTTSPAQHGLGLLLLRHIRAAHREDACVHQPAHHHAAEAQRPPARAAGPPVGATLEHAPCTCKTLNLPPTAETPTMNTPVWNHT